MLNSGLEVKPYKIPDAKDTFILCSTVLCALQSRLATSLQVEIGFCCAENSNQFASILSKLSFERFLNTKVCFLCMKQGMLKLICFVESPLKNQSLSYRRTGVEGFVNRVTI